MEYTERDVAFVAELLNGIFEIERKAMSKILKKRNIGKKTKRGRKKP